MALALQDTTQSTTSSACTRGSRSSAHRHTMPWPWGWSSTNWYPCCLKTTRRSTHRSSASKPCWMQLSLRTWPLCVEKEGGVRTLTTNRARTWTRPVASLHQRSMVGIEMAETCMTWFESKMHATRLKTGAKNETTLSTSGVMNGTAISMAPTTTSPTDNILQMENTMKGGGSRLSLATWR
jgi:hypothetical protein